MNYFALKEELKVEINSNSIFEELDFLVYCKGGNCHIAEYVATLLSDRVRSFQYDAYWILK